MMNNAPLQEPAGDAWSTGWTNWFNQAVRALGGWKKTLTRSATIDFGAIGAQGELTSAVTVTGAKVNDAVLVTPSANTTGVFYVGVVTATGTVTVYAKNFTGGAINPASATFHIVIFQN